MTQEIPATGHGSCRVGGDVECMFLPYLVRRTPRRDRYVAVNHRRCFIITVVA